MRCPLVGRLAYVSSWPKAAELTQAATFGAEKRQMLPPRPHADLDACTDREGILLNCAQGRPRTRATFKPADGALRGPHLPGKLPAASCTRQRATTRSAIRSCNVRSRANARERLFTRVALATNARLLSRKGHSSYTVDRGVICASLAKMLTPMSGRAYHPYR